MHLVLLGNSYDWTFSSLVRTTTLQKILGLLKLKERTQIPTHSHYIKKVFFCEKQGSVIVKFNGSYNLLKVELFSPSSLQKSL